jgi:hypothetical protein
MAEVHVVEVDAENLVLAQALLDAKGEQGFAHLARQRAFLADDENLGHLLRDAGPALHHLPRPQIGPGRAQDAQVVDAAVFVEASVLSGDKGFANQVGDLLDGQKHALFHEELADELAVRAPDLAGADGLVVGHRAQVGGQVGFKLAIHPVAQPSAESHRAQDQAADNAQAGTQDRARARHWLLFLRSI